MNKYQKLLYEEAAYAHHHPDLRSCPFCVEALYSYDYAIAQHDVPPLLHLLSDICFFCPHASVATGGKIGPDFPSSHHDCVTKGSEIWREYLADSEEVI